MEIMDKKERDKLTMKYAPLVKNIAERIAVKVPPHIADKDDLTNVGIIGLISALKKFDKKMNVRFETYARFRIKGAILDELRSRDWMPRSIRSKNTKLEEAYSSLQKKLGRPPDEEEVSRYLSITLAGYYKLLDEAKGVTLLGNGDGSYDFCEKYGSSAVIETIDRGSPFSIFAGNELKTILKKAIDSLPGKERLVLSLYYYEELTMKEVGMVMRLTESRICQLHSQAILRLRGKMKEVTPAISA